MTDRPGRPVDPSPAAGETQPRRDLAGAAMRQLRSRQTAVQGVNEIFAAFRSFVRGMNALFMGRDGDSTSGGDGPMEKRRPHG